MGKEVRSRSRPSKKQSGSEVLKSVKTKIELTNSPTTVVDEKGRVEKIRDAAFEYRQNISVSGGIVRAFVNKECNGNLLKMKLVLWSALQEVERMMKEGR